MATLTLNANTASPITVVCQRAGKGVPRRVGSKTYSFAGAERSSVRGQAKVISITTSYVDTATEALIQNAGYNGAALPCSGDILGNIQTVCSFENVVSNMMPGLPGFFEMSFTLNEVQASVVLLRYSPGDTITGENFTRSSIGYQINASGVLVSKAINAKRDGHFINGIQSLLLEGPATNSLLWSTDYSNAAWVKTSCTVATGIADPAGGTQACTLTATAPNAQIDQLLSAGASAARATSVWLRRRTGSGTVNVWNPQTPAWTPVVLTAAWQRFIMTGAAATLREGAIQITVSGDAVDAFGFQIDDTSFATSTILTTSGTVTRGADFYSLPFTTPPQELSVYAKFVESGSKVVSGPVFHISDSGSATPLFRAIGTGAAYQAQHFNPGAVSSLLGAGPALADIAELEARLFGDGSVDATQSLNGGASTAATQSAALALASAWSAQLCWLNSVGTTGTVGFTALQSFKIAAGTRSLSEMRAA